MLIEHGDQGPALAHVQSSGVESLGDKSSYIIVVLPAST